MWSTVRVASHQPSGQTAAHLGPCRCVSIPHLQFPACLQEEERWGEASNDEGDPKEKALPEDPETCLQLNMVYQEVVREKLAEVSLLLAQNREQQVRQAWPRRRRHLASGDQALGPILQGSRCWLTHWGLLCLLQEEVMGDLAGVRGLRVKDGRNPPPNLYLGHFMKPYFRDKVTGVVSGPPPARVSTPCCGRRDFLEFSEACSLASLN